MSGKLRSKVSEVSKRTRVKATLIDVVGDRCSVRIGKRGRPIYGLSYIGGPAKPSTEVWIDYSSGTPVVQMLGSTYVPPATRTPVRVRSVSHDTIPQGGDGSSTEQVADIRIIFPTGIVTHYTADADGLADVETSQVDGCTIILPAARTISFDTFTLGSGVTLSGEKISATLDGRLITGDNTSLENFSLVRVVNTAEDLVGIEVTGATGMIMTNVIVKITNTGAGKAHSMIFTGTPGWVGMDSVYLRAVSSNEARNFYSTVTNGGVDAYRCTLSNSVQLSSFPNPNFHISVGVEVRSLGSSYNNGYVPNEWFVYQAGDRNATMLQTFPVSSTPPQDGNVLVYNLASGQWLPGAGGGGGGSGTGSGGDMYFSLDGEVVACDEIVPPIVAARDFVISAVGLYVGDAGASGETTLDVKLNGVSIFGTSLKPSVIYNDEDHIDERIPETTAVSKGAVISFDLTAAANGAGRLTWYMAIADTPGSSGIGDMTTAVYDTDHDGVVDNAENLQGHPASYFSISTHLHDATYSPLGHTHAGMGDMLKSVYDADDDGIVNNAEALNGHGDTYFATADHTHEGAGTGDMQKVTYDTDDDGIVDNSENLQGHAASYFATSTHNHTGVYATASHTHAGMGDMLKATYDTDNDGTVDNSEALNGHPDTYFAVSGHTHEGAGLGDMTKSTYDTDDDGVVDNSEALEGHPASYFSISGHNHDLVYSNISHLHTGVYSPVDHNHSGVYSPVDHNHSGVYSPTDHTHVGMGDMLKATYDADNDGTVDNSEALQGHAASYFATADHTHEGSGIGDMLKSTYDTDNDGVVDEAETLEGHAASYFATADHTHEGATGGADILAVQVFS